MILKGSQRGGASALATHLLNEQDNDFVEVAAINGFMSETVEGAFQEIHAASRGTSCKQFMFSLSLSPPEDAVVSQQDFQNAIDDAMQRLGLSDQPHVVIFHEKNGRRHCHLVVSRIDTRSMKAINLSFFKEKLCTLSRELYLTHGWKLPDGHVDRALSNPLNYSLEEHQVAKRARRDPKATKTLLKDCWAQSDDRASFVAALHEAGFVLCKGDRRAFVAVDDQGKVYSLSRWLDIKTNVLIERLGEPDNYPSIEEARETLSPAHGAKASKIDQDYASTDPRITFLKTEIEKLQSQKADLLAQHRQQRDKLKLSHERQYVDHIKAVQKSQTRLRDLWNLVTGKRQALIATRRAVLDELKQRQELEFLDISNQQRTALRDLRSKITALSVQLEALEPQTTPEPVGQLFEQPVDPDFLLHQQLIKRSPDHVLRVINDKKAVFTRNDIVRSLADYISDPAQLRTAIDRVLASSELVELEDSTQKINPRFTTREFQKLETDMLASADVLSTTKAYGVQPHHMNAAINRQNAALQKQVGANLSDEQRKAIEHILNRRQLSCVVGLAGAGKSTMLSAANEAWMRQGYRVLGGALAGKAAAGLQNASNIPSRTLASWEHGWKYGRNLLQAGDVLVIDEAGMVGSGQLSRIIDHIHKQGAKLVLVGDPDQLQPINAGTPFRDIANKVGFAELSEIRRQKLDWQKAASLDLARGNTEKALQAYEDHGCVETTANHHDAIAALVEDYMVDLELHGDSKSRLALAHSRRDVFEINQAIRAARKSGGDLNSERIYKTAHGSRSFAPGDRVLFTLNDAQLGIKNGMLGVVKQADDEALTVKLDDSSGDRQSRRVEINARSYSSFDYGYATTIHKAQGITVDNSFVLQSRSMDHHLKYVGLSRHRDNLLLYQNSELQSEIEIEP